MVFSRKLKFLHAKMLRSLRRGVRQRAGEDVALIKKINDSGAPKMKIVGRGTLIMSAAEARNSKEFKEKLIEIEQVMSSSSHA